MYRENWVAGGNFAQKRRRRIKECVQLHLYISALLMCIFWVHWKHYNLHCELKTMAYNLAWPGWTLAYYSICWKKQARQGSLQWQLMAKVFHNAAFMCSMCVCVCVRENCKHEIDMVCLLTTPNVKIGWLVDMPLHVRKFCFQEKPKVYVTLLSDFSQMCLSSHWRSFYFFLSDFCIDWTTKWPFLLAFFWSPQDNCN